MSKKFNLHSKFQPAGDQPAAIKNLTQGLNDGLVGQTLLGVTGSGKTFTMAHIIQNLQRPALIMAHNKTLAAQLYGEMKEFFPDNAVEYFVSYYDYYQPEAYVPSSNTYIEKDSSINDHIEQMRLSATKALMERRDVIIIASVSAIYGLGDPKSYHAMVLHIERGSIINQREILKRLADLQYSRNDVDLRRGTFRVQGEIIDIFPADSEKDAIRIYLFDEEIEDIAYFDPLTGEILRKAARVTVYPKTHYATPREVIVKAIDEIKEDLNIEVAEFEKQDKLVEAQRLKERALLDLEMMNEVGFCSGIENYSRYLSGAKIGEAPPTLFDYFPKDGILFIDESHVTVSQIGAMYKGDRARKENLVNYGFRLKAALDNRPLKFEEFEHRRGQTIYVSATPADYEKNHSDKIVEQVVRPTGLIDPPVEIRPVASQVDDLLSEIKKTVGNGSRVLVTTLTKRMSEDLTSYLAEHNVRVKYLHSDIDTVQRMEIIRELRLGEFDVLVGINLLREGLDIPEVELVAILDADKEGFLRSDRSLIQTIGRAARNINGRAILYADRITGSMRRALDETERRRDKQVAFNEKHGITPAGINKKIADILETSSAQLVKRSIKGAKKFGENYAMWSESKLEKHVVKLENEMFDCARDLDFERAARLRDEVKFIRESFFLK